MWWNKGVAVKEIQDRSPAARVGLEEGDIIMQVNRKRVNTINELARAIDDINGNIVLGVKRGDNSIFVLIQ